MPPGIPPMPVMPVEVLDRPAPDDSGGVVKPDELGVDEKAPLPLGTPWAPAMLP